MSLLSAGFSASFSSVAHRFTLLMASPNGAAGEQQSPFTMFLPLIMIVVIFYFMIFRPQKKRQKEREALLGKMDKGDKVVTASGIHGTVAQIEDSTVLLQVAENTKLRVEKSAINMVLPKK